MRVSVIGAGAAGIAAAIHLAYEGVAVDLYERHNYIGGQISHSAWVENMPPFSAGFSGEHFRRESLAQLQKHRVVIRTGIDMQQLPSGPLLVATGRQPKPFPFVASIIHTGLGLITTPGSVVLVVGSGNSAGQAALHYRKYGSRVFLLFRSGLRDRMSASVVDALKKAGVYAICGEIRNIEPEAGVVGPWHSVTIRSLSGNELELFVTAVHVLAGLAPDTSLMRPLKERGVSFDTDGYIVVNKHYRAAPLIYAAGDCVSGAVRRVTCAIGSANEAAHYLLEEMGRK